EAFCLTAQRDVVAAQIPIPDRDLARLERQIELLLAVAQRLFRAMPIGPVVVHADQPARLSGSIVDRHPAAAEPAHLAVGADDAKLELLAAAMHDRRTQRASNRVQVVGMDEAQEEIRRTVERRGL